MAKKKVVTKNQSAETTPTKKAPKKKAAPKKAAKKTPRKKSSSPAQKGSASEETSTSREIIYPEIKTQHAKKLGIAQAKKLLGWYEGKEVDKETALLVVDNKNVACNNNVRNRPLTPGNWARCIQDILRRKWRMNGETIIIGKTGFVLNGQHQLVAVVLAHMEWEKNRGKWKETWDGEAPYIEKLVVFGIDESDDTVNTMDTCKPRSMADVIYRSEYFKDTKKKDRNKLSRMLQNAVSFLWARTGMCHDAFAPRRTHMEAIDFIERHPTLLKAVNHIFVENAEGNVIGKCLSPGYATGLLYLMAASETNDDESDYTRGDSNPNESMLDMSAWEKACEFWVLLNAGDKRLETVKHVIAAAVDEDEGSTKARIAILIKAWGLFSTGKKVTTDALALQYEQDEDEFYYLVDAPMVSGIDMGWPVEQE